MSKPENAGRSPETHDWPHLALRLQTRKRRGIRFLTDPQRLHQYEAERDFGMQVRQKVISGCFPRRAGGPRFSAAYARVACPHARQGGLSSNLMKRSDQLNSHNCASDENLYHCQGPFSHAVAVSEISNKDAEMQRQAQGVLRANKSRGRTVLRQRMQLRLGVGGGFLVRALAA